MKKLILTATSACCALGVTSAQESGAATTSQKSEPNILIILCDQQRYDCLGYTGNEIVSTPNIDKLASQGMQFTRTYSPIPTSCPARQTLLSGAWPEQLSHKGLWNYDIALPVNLFEGDTWTEHLDARGYCSGYIGKWHVHPEKTPLDFGFDDYIFAPHYVKSLKGKKYDRVLNKEGNAMMGGYTEQPTEEGSVHWYKDRAIELIEEYAESGKPWHLRLDYVEPHLPCFPSKEYFDKYADVKIPEWENFRDDFDNKPYIQKQQVYNWALENYKWGEWEKYMRSYYAMIEQIDDAIGQLLTSLEEKGLLENTIVIYTADHGDASGCHKMLDKHYVMYEEEVHIPLIVRWDGVVEPNSKCDNFVLNGLDIAATVSDVVGLDYKTSGASLLPLLKQEKVPGWREYAFSNYNGQQFGLFVQRMIRDERYKYVWAPTDVDEFYDLKKDPYEMNNLIYDKSYKVEIKRLREALYHDLVDRKDAIAGAPTAAKRQLLGDGKL